MKVHLYLLILTGNKEFLLIFNAPGDPIYYIHINTHTYIFIYLNMYSLKEYFPMFWFFSIDVFVHFPPWTDFILESKHGRFWWQSQERHRTQLQLSSQKGASWAQFRTPAESVDHHVINSSTEQGAAGRTALCTSTVINSGP